MAWNHPLHPSLFSSLLAYLFSIQFLYYFISFYFIYRVRVHIFIQSYGNITTVCIFADPLLFWIIGVEHLTANIIMNLILFFDDYIRHRDGNFKVIKMAIHEMWTSFLRKKSTEIRNFVWNVLPNISLLSGEEQEEERADDESRWRRHRSYA